MHVRAGARSAFTLIEVLVVIAVVAVLASLLLPSLAEARKAAKGTVCLSGLRSMGAAVHMYADASDDHFPISSHTAGSLVAPDAWLTTLEEYGVDRQFRRCPLDDLRAQKLTSYATNEHFEPLAPGIDYNPVTGGPLPGGGAYAHTTAWARSHVPRRQSTSSSPTAGAPPTISTRTSSQAPTTCVRPSR